MEIRLQPNASRRSWARNAPPIFRLLCTAGAERRQRRLIGRSSRFLRRTLSFHLAHLSRVGLIKGRQESRFIYYVADYATMDELLAYLHQELLAGQPVPAQGLPPLRCEEGQPRRSPLDRVASAMTERVFNILFLCTGIPPAAYSRKPFSITWEGSISGLSARQPSEGSQSSIALELLEQNRFPWRDCAASPGRVCVSGSASARLRITVCDNAVGEACPICRTTDDRTLGDRRSGRDGGQRRRKARSLLTAFSSLHRRYRCLTSLPFASSMRWAINANSTASAGCAKRGNS